MKSEHCEARTDLSLSSRIQRGTFTSKWQSLAHNLVNNLSQLVEGYSSTKHYFKFRKTLLVLFSLKHASTKVCQLSTKFTVFFKDSYRFCVHRVYV